MATTIQDKPIDQINWLDLEALIATGMEEGQTFELKRELPVKDGRQRDPWMNGQSDKISDHARDALAREVVAFANAYGGTIVVGINETEDMPARASSFVEGLIPRIADLEERLQRALRDRIDPPINGLAVKGVASPDGEGAGIIVIRVPASPMAPHGVGRPAEAYVRRGTSAEPMTMRDLQNVFWEARTKIERIQKIREKRREALTKLESQRLSRKLPLGCLPQDKFWTNPSLQFRCTAIFEDRIDISARILEALSGRVERIFERPHLLALPNKSAVSEAAFGIGPFFNTWRPGAHCIQSLYDQSEAVALWTIFDDGTVDLCGVSIARTSDDGFHPGWFCVSAAHVLLIAEEIKRAADRSNLPYIIDIEFQNQVDINITKYIGYYEKKIILQPSKVEIGPFSIGRRIEISSVFEAIERQIWFGLGISPVISENIDFERTMGPDVL